MVEKSIHIKNELKQVALLNDFIGRIVEECRIASPVGMYVKLAVEEAVVNSILYAYPGESDRDIIIRMGCEPGKLTIVITDNGIAFDPTKGKEPDITLPAERRPIGGLGIFLTKRLMTQVTYRRENDKNILTLTKELL